MVRLFGKKWTRCATAAYLVIAAMGTFALTAFDTPVLDSLAGKGPDQGVFLTSSDRFINTPAVSRTKENNFSPLRHCLLRIIMPLSLAAAGSGILGSAVRSTAITTVKSNKNDIIIKLRI
jgi:hypothetical protein